MHSIKLVGFSTAVIMFFTFLRDWPIIGTGSYDAAGKEVKESALTSASKNVEWYDGADLMVPMSNPLTNYTWLGFELTPMMGAIGWFMRFRVALLVSLGTFFTWLVVTPLAYHYDYPFYYPIYTRSEPIASIKNNIISTKKKKIMMFQNTNALGLCTT